MKKPTLIFAVIRENGKENSGLYETWGDYHTATFSPEMDVVAVHPLVIHGRTYRERQESLRDLAIDIQYADNGGLSYGELADIQSFFEEHGRRLGLLREFRENCIC